MEREKDKEFEEMRYIIQCPDDAEDLMTYAIWKYNDIIKKKLIRDTGGCFGNVTVKSARYAAQEIIKRKRRKWVCLTSVSVLLIEFILLVICFFLHWV